MNPSYRCSKPWSIPQLVYPRWSPPLQTPTLSSNSLTNWKRHFARLTEALDSVGPFVQASWLSLVFADRPWTCKSGEPFQGGPHEQIQDFTVSIAVSFCKVKRNDFKHSLLDQISMKTRASIALQLVIKTPTDVIFSKCKKCITLWKIDKTSWNSNLFCNLS